MSMAPFTLLFCTTVDTIHCGEKCILSSSSWDLTYIVRDAKFIAIHTPRKPQTMFVVARCTHLETISEESNIHVTIVPSHMHIVRVRMMHDRRHATDITYFCHIGNSAISYLTHPPASAKKKCAVVFSKLRTCPARVR